jgi:RNA polymerase sigma factor (sigma-70 family)
MDRDASVPPAGVFPLTRYSVLEAVASEDRSERERAFGALAQGYWKPIYKYLRVRWRAAKEEAEDLTQEFFTRALEKQFFDRYDPAVARFRTYLRTCVDRFVANQRRAAGRSKRGGDLKAVPFDFAAVEGELAQSGIPESVDVEEYFQREWMRSFFEGTVDALRRRCEGLGKRAHFQLFERYDLEDGGARPTYGQLAAELGLPVTQVTNYLSWVRREFRRLALERLRATAASEEEFRAEARQVLGVEPP